MLTVISYKGNTLGRVRGSSAERAIFDTIKTAVSKCIFFLDDQNIWLLLEQSKMPVPVKFPHTASCLLLGRLFVSNLIFLWHNVLFAVADKPDTISEPVCHFFFLPP